jgi:large subunit ribosomal protein L6
MSRIGQKPINIPENVKLNFDRNSLIVKGPKGRLVVNLSRELKLRQEESTLLVERKKDTKKARSMHGLVASLVANAIEGVTNGFVRELEMVGVGYRVRLEGKNLILSVGFSHTVKVEPPEGIEFSLSGNTKIAVSGIDKQAVGEIAAKIRKVRPPEPYKGKGIRYKGEVVRKKPGKAAKAVGT